MGDGKYLGYRWAVFLLALGYWIYQFKSVIEGAGFGWQFRYLTIWALTLSLWSAWRVLRFAMGRGAAPYLLASVAMVMNGLVVVLYWRLYFTDPTLVNNGEILWWQEYYLHLAGPVVQWFDALILLGAFRAPLRVLVAMAGLIVAYVVWIELGVAPLNDLPTGTVTRGLPYPFLNNMELSARMMFYLSTAVLALFFIALGMVAYWLRGRVARHPHAA